MPTFKPSSQLIRALKSFHVNPLRDCLSHLFPQETLDDMQRHQVLFLEQCSEIGESQATCASCRCAQAESSMVLPKPAGAESRVSGVASAPSNAESKGSRSTSAVGKRGGASLPESTSIPSPYYAFLLLH